MNRGGLCNRQGDALFLTSHHSYFGLTISMHFPITVHVEGGGIQCLKKDTVASLCCGVEVSFCDTLLSGVSFSLPMMTFSITEGGHLQCRMEAQPRTTGGYPEVASQNTIHLWLREIVLRILNSDLKSTDISVWTSMYSYLLAFM